MGARSSQCFGDAETIASGQSSDCRRRSGTAAKVELIVQTTQNSSDRAAA
jgi:hypothetical protein